LLTPAEQQTFRRLAVFVGGWTLELAEAVLADEAKQLSALDQLSSLVNQSLVQRIQQEDGEPRFVMLETIREFALERLHDQGELPTCQQRHAAAMLRLAEQAAPLLTGPEQVQWVQHLRREQDNLRAALQWGLHHHVEVAANLLNLNWAFWLRHVLPRESLHWHQQAIGLGGHLAVPLRIKLLRACGRLLCVVGQVAQAEACLHEALGLVQQHTDQVLHAQVLNDFAVIAIAKSDTNLSVFYYEQSLALFRQHQNVFGLALVLNGLGNVNIIKDRHAEAAAYYEESLHYWRQLGDTWGMAAVLGNLGLIARYAGRYSEAEAYTRESLSLRRELGALSGVAIALENLAMLLFYRDEHDQAREYFTEALHIYRYMDMKKELATCLGLYGFFCTTIADLLGAEAAYSEMCRLGEWLQNDDLRGGAFVGLASVAILRADGEQTLDLLTQGFALYRSLSDGQIIGYLDVAADLMLYVQQHEHASRLLAAMSALRDRLGAPLPPVSQPLYEQHLALLRTSLGAARFEHCWNEGYAADPKALMAEALGLERQEAEVGAVACEPAPAAPAESYPAGLTQREVEVLRLVAQGLTNPQIAEQLVISRVTVNAHLRSIFSKLDVATRSAATRFAVEQGLTSDE
jgi:DNA-binding CsgD family transcriptional regulator/tetratricopeptide (TPR) repeat protein